MAESAFVRLRSIADIAREDGARYQPRLHDLRHHADNRVMPSGAAETRPVALGR
jgi:hypothetical protein